MPTRQCPTCRRSDRLTAIDMTVTRGHVTMIRCTDCEMRWWETNGVRVGFATVRLLAGPDLSRRHHMQMRRDQRTAA